MSYRVRQPLRLLPTSRTLRNLVGVGLLAATALVCLSTRAAAQAEVGVVLDVYGGWYIDDSGRRPLRKGDGVPAGGVLRIEAPAGADSIRILLSNGKTLVRRCVNADECSRPTFLPRALPRETSTFEAIVEAGLRWFRRDAGRYSVHQVRSLTGSLREAVLEARGGRVDFAPALAEMAKGTYQLCLDADMTPDPLLERGECQRQLSVVWDKTSASNASPAPINPGLYQLIVLERRHSGVRRTMNSAWVLVVGPSQYARAAASFGDARQLAGSWGEEFDEGTARGFLRAYLEYLLTQAGKAGGRDEQKNTAAQTLSPKAGEARPPEGGFLEASAEVAPRARGDHRPDGHHGQDGHPPRI